MALERELVLRLAGDAELAREHLGGLPHVEAAHEIREALGERDARREHPGPEA